MLRKLLRREGRWFLQELGVPNWRALLLRAVFYGFVWTGTLGVGLGLVWLCRVAGTEAMLIATGVIILIALWMERNMPSDYSGAVWWLGEQLPALPPPGQPSLPAPGTPRLGRSSTALTTRHQPALPKNSPK